MHDVAAGWLMTSLAPSPVMVSLVQAAVTLPMFLLALPAGALADVVDRRRVLLLTQTWGLVAAGSLAVFTVAGSTTPSALLIFTFALGAGAALNAPAFQAVIPELVPKGELPAALTLNGVAINLSRAVGPAVGGAILAMAGPGWVFSLNALSFLAVIVVLYRWRRPERKSALPAERLWGAMRVGVRYARHAPALQAVLVRGGAFILCASALWALLPLIARQELGRGPAGYGLVVGSLGAGAVAGAALLPRIRRRISPDRLVAIATMLFAAVLLAAAFVRSFPVFCGAMAVGGSAWLALLTSFNTSAQVAVPSWVRGRALSAYLLVFFGGMAAGSALWGKVAALTSIPAALALAAAGMIAGLAATVRLTLGAAEVPDLTASKHWPTARFEADPEPDRGPVVVTTEYRIDPDALPDFTRAMVELRRIRLRDGALRWELYSDPGDPGRYVEAFAVESWLEHLRQHERITVADREVEARPRSFHTVESPPAVTHLVAEPLPKL